MSRTPGLFTWGTTKWWVPLAPRPCSEPRRPHALWCGSARAVNVFALFNSLFALAQGEAAAGNMQSAAALLEEGDALQPAHAELHFRWAEALRTLANASAAEHYQLACDYDALPFRATRRINSLITNA